MARSVWNSVHRGGIKLAASTSLRRKDTRNGGRFSPLGIHPKNEGDSRGSSYSRDRGSTIHDIAQKKEKKKKKYLWFDLYYFFSSRNLLSYSIFRIFEFFWTDFFKFELIEKSTASDKWLTRIKRGFIEVEIFQDLINISWHVLKSLNFVSFLERNSMNSWELN